MRFIVSALLVTLALGAAAPSFSQDRPPPCAAPEHRAFDFWIGEWNVHAADGRLAGTNSIKREIGGCVLHERYETGRGYSGESFNVYDARRKVWHQTWVDSSGLLLLLEGGLQDGKMVLEGQTTAADQSTTRQRISWTPNPDGSVRQLWEARGKDGQWTVVFDGKYTRRTMADATQNHHQIDYIEFSVTDMAEAQRFYSAAFDWEFTDYGPQYAGIRKRQGGEVGGLSLQAEVAPGGPLVILYSQDLEQTLARVRDAGGGITREIFEFPGGRRFQFKDPSGNELAVWSDR